MSAVLLIFYVSVLSGCGQKEMDSGSARAMVKEMDAMKEIYLAGGCFWGVQKFFDLFDGVVVTVVLAMPTASTARQAIGRSVIPAATQKQCASHCRGRRDGKA